MNDYDDDEYNKRNCSTVMLEPEEDEQFEFVNTDASNRLNDTLIWSFESQSKQYKKMSGALDSMHGGCATGYSPDEKHAIHRAPIDKQSNGWLNRQNSNYLKHTPRHQKH